MALVLNGTTGVSGVAGSASAPALIGSDADSGYYINSANEPNASVNGTATWSAASTFGFKNRLINGNMTIDQRNAGASVTPALSGSYIVDRWQFNLSQASKVTLQQNAGSVTPPAGFKKYLGATTASAYSVGASDYFMITQPIEGFNMADLGWGAAGASTITLSFWARSSLTGTFGGALENGDANRAYAFSYTINAANTWEYKTVTIAGDTTGTWASDNTAGVNVRFALGVGSGYSGAGGSWGSTRYFSVTGATSVVGTLNATLYITGVQFEKGSTATSFDFRDYGRELILCQRYYEKSYSSAVPGTGSAAPGLFDISTASESTYAYSYIPFKVNKRDVPTMTGYTYSSGVSGSWSYARSGAGGNNTVSFGSIGVSSCTVSISIGAAWTACEVYGHWTASSEL